MVAHGDEEFPAIVGVDNADLVGRGQIAATGKPAAGKYQTDITLRDLHGDADGDQARLTGRQHNGRIQAGAQIVSQKAGVMVKRSIFAYVNRDTEAAQAVIALDDEVDALFRTIKGELVELIAGNRDEADQAIDLIIIAKYLERIADHAVNIAQWAIFCVTGEILG